MRPDPFIPRAAALQQMHSRLWRSASFAKKRAAAASKCALVFGAARSLLLTPLTLFIPRAMAAASTALQRLPSRNHRQRPPQEKRPASACSRPHSQSPR